MDSTPAKRHQDSPSSSPIPLYLLAVDLTNSCNKQPLTSEPPTSSPKQSPRSSITPTVRAFGPAVSAPPLFAPPPVAPGNGSRSESLRPRRRGGKRRRPPGSGVAPRHGHGRRCSPGLGLDMRGVGSSNMLSSLASMSLMVCLL